MVLMRRAPALAVAGPGRPEDLDRTVRALQARITAAHDLALILRHHDMFRAALISEASMNEALDELIEVRGR
jgi:hypothetical protein